jgi:RNA polymerase sigma-70 factor (ECF subfamily)
VSALGPSDAELIARILDRDDRHAFATLVRRHQSPVRTLLRRLTCGDVGAADDLAQETFLAAYTSLGRFRGESRVSTWLYRIAYNRWVDARRARHDEPKSLDDRLVARDVMTGIEARHDLERAMAHLKPDERAALALTYGADATHEEAAAILEIPLGTLKTQVLTAKQKLKAALTEKAS